MKNFVRILFFILGTYLVFFPSSSVIAASGDYDNDGIENFIDFDDDNDGIPDVYECNIRDGLIVGNYADASFNENEFLQLRPSDFGVGSGVINQSVSRDFSALYNLPAGSVIVSITNAHRVDSRDIFFLREDLGNAAVTISGSYPVAIQVEQGIEYDNPNTSKTMRFVDLDLQYVLDNGSSTTGNPAGVTVSESGDTYIISNSTTQNAYLSKRLDLNQDQEKTIEFSITNSDPGGNEITSFYVRFKPLCDFDGDSVPDIYDLDSDNDGCLDSIEGDGGTIAGQNVRPYLIAAAGSVTVGSGSGADAVNFCGDGSCVSDANYTYQGIFFNPNGMPSPDLGAPNLANYWFQLKGVSQAPDTDQDGDGIGDSCDEDNDNDGIVDAVEIGVDIANPIDTDQDGTPDYLDTDADNDGCYDAVEGSDDITEEQVMSGAIAGTVDGMGIPTEVNGGQMQGTGLEAGKISVLTSPQDTTKDVGDNVVFTVSATATKTSVFSTGIPDWSAGSSDTMSYQWQLSTNGGTGWTDIAGETGTSLSLTAVTASMNNNHYRVLMSCTANTCLLESATAILTVNTQAQYAVQHYREQLNSSYSLYETDTFTGTIAETVTGTYNNYTGSGYLQATTYSGTILTGSVLADGSLVLKLYYELDSHTITFSVDGDTSVEPSQSVKHGGSGSEPSSDPSKAGYTFGGWYSDDGTYSNEYDFSSAVLEDITLYGKWEARADTEYSVEHYQEGLDGSYSVVGGDTEILSGTTGSEVSAVAKSYTNYSEDSDHSMRVGTGVIAGDGSLVLKLYYELDTNPIIVTHNASIDEGDIFDITTLLDEASDVEDGVITQDVVIADDGGFDPEVPGVYVIVFSVTDSDGNTSTEEATVAVGPRGGTSSSISYTGSLFTDGPKDAVILTPTLEKELEEKHDISPEKAEKIDANIKQKQSLMDLLTQRNENVIHNAQSSIELPNLLPKTGAFIDGSACMLLQ